MLARLFDIRIIVGALLLIYGVLLTIAGFAPSILGHHAGRSAKSDRVDLYVGTAANWWVGLVLIGVALTFVVWAMLRPSTAAGTDAEQRDGVRG